MKRIMGSFLSVLCDVCGAERARMRLAVADDERPVLLFDQKRRSGDDDGAARRDGTRGDTASRTACGAQIPLLDPGDACFSGGSAGESVVAEAGGPHEPDGVRTWRMSRRVNGFDLDLEVALRERTAGFLNDRVARAEAFLDLFEAIVDGRHFVDDDGDRRDGPLPAFNPPFLGEAPAMISLKRAIGAVSSSDISILIEGESGTGKEVVAHNVHRLSRRQARPLVIASTLEMPHTLLQSELFGHAEGAFTGASRERAGLIESAAGGTFFLDEIGEMPLALQAALLRVLQEREIRRLGESRRRKVDVRFVFATNRDLAELVRKGRFRRDLYFRVAGVRLYVPPLRSRKEDIVPLASHFLARAAKHAGRPAPPLSPSAVRRLVRYRWPGNVRELRNEIERLIALYGAEGAITAAMLSSHIDASAADGAVEAVDLAGGLPEAVRSLERRMIRGALDRLAGNRTKAASELGITRQGLLKKMKRFGDLG